MLKFELVIGTWKWNLKSELGIGNWNCNLLFIGNPNFFGVNFFGGVKFFRWSNRGQNVLEFKIFVEEFFWGFKIFWGKIFFGDNFFWNLNIDF